MPYSMLSVRATRNLREDTFREEPLCFSDVKVLVGRREYNLHRYVLFKASGYFAGRLAARWADSQDLTALRVRSRRVTPAAFGDAVRFIYDREHFAPSAREEDLLVAASFLDVAPLQALVSERLAKAVSDGSCFDLLALAGSCCDEGLRAACIDHIAQNFSRLASVAELSVRFNAIAFRHFLELLGRDVIIARDEYQVFQVLERYVRANTQPLAARRKGARALSEHEADSCKPLACARADAPPPGDAARPREGSLQADVPPEPAVEARALSAEQVSRLCTQVRLSALTLKELVLVERSGLVPHKQLLDVTFYAWRKADKREESADSPVSFAEQPSLAMSSPRAVEPASTNAQQRFSCAVSIVWDVPCRSPSEHGLRPGASHYIRSEPFHDSRGRTFSCVVYPFGSKAKHSMSVYLYAHPTKSKRRHPLLRIKNMSDWSWRSKFRVACVSADEGKTLYSIESVAHVFCAETSNWGWSEYLTKSQALANGIDTAASSMLKLRITVVSCDAREFLK